MAPISVLTITSLSLSLCPPPSSLFLPLSTVFLLFTSISTVFLYYQSHTVLSLSSFLEDLSSAQSFNYFCFPFVHLFHFDFSYFFRDLSFAHCFNIVFLRLFVQLPVSYFCKCTNSLHLASIVLLSFIISMFFSLLSSKSFPLHDATVHSSYFCLSHPFYSSYFGVLVGLWSKPKQSK